MNLQKLNILINDTFVAATLLNIERTENANPVLKYNGSDDEYQPIMASELTFNMLVPDAADGKFLHLFTGNETRYQVQLENKLTGAILWTGFLLPDFYSEPYENGCFFVSFTATDGLARLKNKFLPDDFYKDQKTLPQVLTACLKLTGSYFNTAIAPAITNAVSVIKTKDIEINTINFLNKEKKQDAYGILEDIVTSIGCRLFLWGEMWYIIGINRYNEPAIDFEYYAPDGQFINTTAFTRDNNSVFFEAHPSITAVPPFQDVVINWDKNTRETVFPVDVVYQKNDATIAAAFDPANTYNIGLDMAYWSQTGTGFYKLLGYKTIGADLLNTKTSGPFYVNINNSVDAAEIESKYITLSDPIYVVGNYVDGQTIDVKINYIAWTTADPTTHLEKYKQKFLYEITKNEVVILSNKPAFDVNGLYDFELTVGETQNIGATIYWPILCSVEVPDISIFEDGYINVKLHPAIITATAPTIMRMVVEYCNIKFVESKTSGEYSKKRNIDFTTKKEVSTAYGFTKNDLILNKFLLSESVLFTSFTYTGYSGITAIPILKWESQIINNEYFTNVRSTAVWISEASFNYLKLNIDNIYVKRGATNVYEKLINFLLMPNDTGWCIIQWMPIADIVQPHIGIDDDVYVQIAAQEITITDRKAMNIAWKRVGINELLTYADCLARVYHSTIGDVKFKLEGNVFELVNPLEFFQFDYFAPRNYNATSLTMNLSEGMTTVVFIESVNETIEDYQISEGGVLGEIPDTVIFIEDIEA